MKKIGIITLYYNNNNYGGIAQAYALQKFISNNGYTCELITYKKEKSKINYSKNNSLKFFTKRCFNKTKNLIISKIETNKRKEFSQVLLNRQEKLEKFRSSIPHSNTIYTINSIEEIEKIYDIYITGSDQCWNPGVIDDAFTFNFLKNEAFVFSYAPSIAVNNTTKEYDEYLKKALSKYKYISCREESGKDILTKITNREVEWVVDPTLLLERSDWEQVTSKRLIDEEYIFSYMLGENRKQREYIKSFAEKEGLTLVTIPYIKNGNTFTYRMVDKDFGDIQELDISFEDFFSLIKYSKYVVTDSFHAVIFSCIFEKEFYVYDRSGLVSTNSRIQSLLKIMGIDGRIVEKNIIHKENIDYSFVKKNIQNIITSSKKYLLDALNEGVSDNNEC